MKTTTFNTDEVLDFEINSKDVNYVVTMLRKKHDQLRKDEDYLVENGVNRRTIDDKCKALKQIISLIKKAKNETSKSGKSAGGGSKKGG